MVAGASTTICAAIGPLLMRSVALLASVAGADITAWFAFTDAIPYERQTLVDRHLFRIGPGANFYDSPGGRSEVTAD